MKPKEKMILRILEELKPNVYGECHEHWIGAERGLGKLSNVELSAIYCLILATHKK